MVFTLALMAVSALHAHAAEGDEPDRRERWAELSTSIYGARAPEPTDTVISLEAPKRAEDAALVPMTIRAAPDVVKTDLIIDTNPSPVAARITFGPAGDPRQMKLRVRIDGYTNVHAVAETREGRLLQNARFVKASGGCSAPAGTSDEEALRGIGEMRMRFGQSTELEAPEATLMIRHPNFNGMQMNPQTGGYTPARYTRAITVARGKEEVFSMEADISLSTNPVISFLYKPGSDTPLDVTVTDSGGAVWTQSFDPRQATN
jgi:sulfur-oxidizing protein SoxY